MTKLEKFIKYIVALTKVKFYGKVIISFENGNIVHLKEEKSLKL
jgi:hypothetical protein